MILLFSEATYVSLDQLDWITTFDPVSCPNNCGRTYKGLFRKRHLKQHLIYECGVEPKFQCKHCFKRFARNSQLKCHLIRIHKTIP